MHNYFKVYISNTLQQIVINNFRFIIIINVKILCQYLENDRSIDDKYGQNTYFCRSLS